MEEQGASYADEEHRKFVNEVGHAIQNFGAIEFLLNHFLSELVVDRVLRRNVTEQPVSKRIAVLEQLLLRKSPPLDVTASNIKDLFDLTRGVFRDRNKIAHNPFAVVETPLISGPRFKSGILVVRFHEDGRKDEMIDLAALQACVRRAHDIHGRLHDLFDKLKDR